MLDMLAEMPRPPHRKEDYETIAVRLGTGRSWAAVKSQFFGNFHFLASLVLVALPVTRALPFKIPAWFHLGERPVASGRMQMAFDRLREAMKGTQPLQLQFGP